jgi:hypothetical protein
MTTPSEPVPFGGENGHPRYQVNEKAAFLKTNGCCETCMFCGKVVKKARFLGFTAYGGTFDDAANHEDENGIVGFHPLGSDCARKLKKKIPVYDSSYERI